MVSTTPSYSKKRKSSDGGSLSEYEKLSKEPKLDELLLDSPLPVEWQRCLDIKSGKIHYYNTRTHVRTTEDPRTTAESMPVGIDLELNLACNPNGRYTDVEIDSGAGESEEEEEMMAIVCMQCHMLVMISKASPSCPNCKFLHPPQPLRDHTSFFSPRLLQCKD